MKYVRWKRYGFTHIVDENRQNIPCEAGLILYRPQSYTVCGNWWDEIHFPDLIDEDWAHEYVAEFGSSIKRGLLPPSETDDGKRPLCGNCRKHLEKMT